MGDIVLELGSIAKANIKYMEKGKTKTITRTDIINHLIKKYKYSSYLEIGVQNSVNFSAVKCNYKEGVDPSVAEYHLNQSIIWSLTSDRFFKEVNLNTFDLIFIDGLHHAEQVLKDFENSMACLTDNGTIVLHDCLPENIHQAGREQSMKDAAWCGDVWKAAVYLSKLYEVRVIDADWGVGVVKKQDINHADFNENYYKSILSQYNFDYYSHQLNIVSSENFFND